MTRKHSPVSRSSDALLQQGVKRQDNALRLVLFSMPALLVALLMVGVLASSALNRSVDAVRGRMAVVLVSDAVDGGSLPMMTDTALMRLTPFAPQVVPSDATRVRVIAVKADRVEAVKSALADITGGTATVQAPDAYLQRMQAKMRGVLHGVYAGAFTLLALAALMVMAVLEARLALQAQTIRLMHHLGAYDGTIIMMACGVMMRVAALPMVLGGLLGFGIAGVIVQGVGGTIPATQVMVLGAVLLTVLMGGLLSMTAVLTRRQLRGLP